MKRRTKLEAPHAQISNYITKICLSKQYGVVIKTDTKISGIEI